MPRSEQHHPTFGSDPSRSVARGIEAVQCRERVVDSVDLFGSGRLVVIRHEGQSYRLQMTAAGKLLMTK